MIGAPNLNAIKEQERLHDLYSYEILDTDAEAAFDELVEIASHLSGCPLAAITFVDKDRQWFKAKKGDSICETPRNVSFCAQTILSDEPLIVADATKDERFASNPDVTNGLGIRFYAGVPIYSANKRPIGAVCVIDKKPRTKVSDTELSALKLISRQVSTLLGLRIRNKLLRQYSAEVLRNSEKAFQAFFEQSNVPKWIYEIDTLKFLQVNEAVLKKYGYTKEEFSRMSVVDVRTMEARKNIHQLLQVLKSNDKPSVFNATHQTKQGQIIQVEVSIVDIVYRGRLARIATIIDITENEHLRETLKYEQNIHEQNLKYAEINAIEETKDFIGKELHDNINQILTTIKLYLELADRHEEMAKDMIGRCRVTIVQAIEAVRQLSKSLVSPVENDFNIEQAIVDLLATISLSNTIAIESSIEKGVEELPSDLKLNLFRIFQEQMNNIVKHAKATKIRIKLGVADRIYLQIEDDGVGFYTGKKSNGIGLKNMRKRTEFYNGIFDISSHQQKGTNVQISIPLEEVFPLK